MIKQLVKKLALDIKIVGMPTFREENGLAMSSRNVRLSQAERSKAGEIHRELETIKLALNNGESDFKMIEKAAFDNLMTAGFTPDYVVIRETATLQAPKDLSSELVILIAAKLGQVRLIDNLRV